MLAAHHPPNTTTYNALISAHSRAGSLDRVMETFREMIRSGCERRWEVHWEVFREGARVDRSTEQSAVDMQGHACNTVSL
jgi:pentatricopeptide repeat protein